MVDSASEGQETTVRYLIDHERIHDDMFLKGDTPRSINEFRVYNKKIKQWMKTQMEAKKMVKSRLGRIEDKFFALIPKALAFKPTMTSKILSIPTFWMKNRSISRI